MDDKMQKEIQLLIDRYNREYFYLNFHKNIKWIIIAMILCSLFNDGLFWIICFLIYMLYGICMEIKLKDELEQRKRQKEIEEIKRQERKRKLEQELQENINKIFKK